jgi:hypothetical protein
MASLSGQTIQSTYPGLLKLETATTGITSNLQAIQDGLGNNTGLRITIGQLESDNFPSFVPLKAQYYGPGFTATNIGQFGAGLQNIILASPFYDNGNYSYSALTLYTTTATSTSDTIELALYTTQMINPIGLYPHAPVVSGITADTTTQGQKTFVFPSNVSFSGYGAGVYWLVYKISNSGVQPTWRGGLGNTTQLTNVSQIYGVTQSTTANVFSSALFRTNNVGGNFQAYTGTTTFDNPFSATLNTTQSSSTTLTGNMPGFILHTTN